MPTYEYKCDACGYSFECFQSISDGPKRKCRSCGKMKLRRVISAGAGVIFKGSGFYETDYKRSTAGKTSSSEKKESGADSAKKESRSGDKSSGSKEKAAD